MAKSKRQVIASFDGLKLKRYLMRQFQLSEDDWFALYADLKRRGVLLSLTTASNKLQATPIRPAGK